MSTTYAFQARQHRPAMLYQRVHVESQVGGDATPHRLTAMLFDGALESMNRAKGALLARDLQTKGNAVGRAINIIDGGLRAALDPRAGGQLAADLHGLYSYILTRLTQANLNNDVDAIDECIGLLQPIREAWQAIAPGHQVAS
jgi:flagellar protein FliS